MVTKSNGNMYPDKDTWNPLGGECMHDCNYCYRNSWKKRSMNCKNKYSGRLRLWDSEFKSLGDRNEIFVCSMTDLFASNVPDNYIRKIINHCNKYDNFYLFQSKNPSRFLDYLDILPPKFILGTTIETNRNTNGCSKAPNQIIRAESMAQIRKKLDIHPDKYHQLMISIEPIMDFDLNPFVKMIRNISPNYVSIGADSKNNRLNEPVCDEINGLISSLKMFTQVKLKDNLYRIC